VAFLLDGQREGRPVLFSWEGLPVPRLKWTSEDHERPLALPQAAWVAVRTEDPDAFDLAYGMALENERVRAPLRFLAAAALRDICAWGPEEITAELFRDDPKSAKRAAKRGRLLWARLGAWPWWGAHHWFSQSPGSALPAAWWENSAATEALHDWRYARLTN
jgi:hypothetical protein